LILTKKTQSKNN